MKYVKKHGESRPPTKEYAAWFGIKNRCYNKKNIGYKYYGGRGIIMCDRWNESYENFLADVGRAPSRAHSIDRINNDGNYEPGNCRWATRLEQNHNKRYATSIIQAANLNIEYDGKTQSIMQWAKELDLDYHSMHDRIIDQKKTLKQIIDFEKFGINPVRMTPRGKKNLFKNHSKKFTQRLKQPKDVFDTGARLPEQKEESEDYNIMIERYRNALVLSQSRESLLKEEVERLNKQNQESFLATFKLQSKIQELEQKNKEMEEQLDLAIHGGNVFKNQADELKQVLKNFYKGFVSQFPKPPDYENIEKLLKQ